MKIAIEKDLTAFTSYLMQVDPFPGKAPIEKKLVQKFKRGKRVDKVGKHLPFLIL